MPRPSRTNSCTPRRSSSFLMRTVTLDCTRCSCCAARVTPPARATVRKRTRSESSIDRFPRWISSQRFILRNVWSCVESPYRHWSDDDMEFILYCIDKPQRADLRRKVRVPHLEYLAGRQQVFRYGG